MNVRYRDAFNPFVTVKLQNLNIINNSNSILVFQLKVKHGKINF